MANKFCVSLTHSKDNTDKATVAFVVANAAAGSGKETLVFLSVEGANLAQKGYADGILEEGFAPLGSGDIARSCRSSAIWTSARCSSRRARREPARWTPCASCRGTCGSVWAS
jgi:predicted peroxiredoxin